ncbi:MAG: response regulator [Gammaproteobacteria bacterium]
MAEQVEILCVDDEPQVVEGLEDLLAARYRVHTATSGATGLQLLREMPRVAVVVSDMRMPVMDGAAFLAQVKVMAPSAVRMLLTGYSDMESAIAAVNKGQIFRFLTKPCGPDDLLSAFEVAVKQHQLLTAEKVLLQQTLLGCLKSLLDVLSLVEPVAFGRAQRLKRIAQGIAREAGLEPRWPVEAAALLCQLGCIGLSGATLMKLYSGESLDDEDEREVSAGVLNARNLLLNIPRLEPVLEILAGLAEGGGPAGARLLRFAMDFDALEARGHAAGLALDTMRARTGRYDAEFLDACGRWLCSGSAESVAEEQPADRLVPGSFVAADVCTRDGVVIVPRGIELTPNVISHIRKFQDSLEKRTIRVHSGALQ